MKRTGQVIGYILRYGDEAHSLKTGGNREQEKTQTKYISQKSPLTRN